MRKILFSVSACLIFLLVTAVSGLDRPVVERELGIYHFDDPVLIETTDSAFASASNLLSDLLEYRLDYRPQVYVVSSQSSFDSLAGNGFPDWGAAVALPHRRMIVVKSPRHFNLNRSLINLLAHEYAHLVLDGRIGLGDVPRWFNEGLAMTVSMEWGWSESFSLNQAAVFGRLVPLGWIENVNAFSQPKASVSYSESYLAVRYLYNTYGKESVNRMLDSLAAGASIDAAMVTATGANFLEFESEFDSYLRGRFNLVMLLADTMFFWLGLAILLLIGGFLRYKRRWRYYRKWEEDEKYHSTDFDYGDPDRPEQIDDDESWRS